MIFIKITCLCFFEKFIKIVIKLRASKHLIENHSCYSLFNYFFLLFIIIINHHFLFYNIINSHTLFYFTLWCSFDISLLLIIFVFILYFIFIFLSLSSGVSVQIFDSIFVHLKANVFSQGYGGHSIQNCPQSSQQPKVNIEIIRFDRPLLLEH